MKHFFSHYTKALAFLSILFCLFSKVLQAQTPTITSFTPSGNCGNSSTTLYIFGSSFTGVTTIMVGGKPVDSFKINSPTSITAYVAKNANGAIKLNTPSGSVTSKSSFTNTNAYNAYAYIPNSIVSVINTASNTVTANVTVGNRPIGISASPDGTKVYVANYGSNSVSVISTATNIVTATLAVGNSPSGICISPNGIKVYVANYASNSVSTINTATNTVIATVGVGSGPDGICISPDGSKVYVVNSKSNTVSVIDTATNTVKATVAVGTYPYGVIVSPDGSKLYVTNYNANSVSVINTATNNLIATVAVGGLPNGVSISPDGTKVYVTNSLSGTVSVINTTTNSVIATVGVGSRPNGLSVSPDGSMVYVANQLSNSVFVINTATNVVVAAVNMSNQVQCIGNFIANVPVACGIITPVTITTIDAANKYNHIAVNWETATELNTHHFNIQQSTDASSFRDIGTVKAVGNGANSYQFTDNNPNKGINYYRLKMVDKDGSFTYSKVVSVILPTTYNLQPITLSPNPAKEAVTVKINSDKKEKAVLQIVNAAGQVVKQLSIALLVGENKTTVPINNLANGSYTLQVKSESNSWQGRFVKE